VVDIDQFLFIDQLKIMGYGESDTSGCWWKLQLTPELLEVVRGRKGQMVEVAVRPIDEHGNYIHDGTYIPPDNEPDPEKPYGKFWREAIINGTFKSKRLAATIGSQAEYEAWTQMQPSCISGRGDYVWGDSEPKCEFAHVRRAGDSGTAFKGDYSGVPLTHDEHQAQHKNGERQCLIAYHKNGDLSTSTEAAKQWFDEQAARNLEAWASITFAKKFGAEKSRAESDPYLLISWLAEHDLTELISSKMYLADSES